MFGRITVPAPWMNCGIAAARSALRPSSPLNRAAVAWVAKGYPDTQALTTSLGRRGVIYAAGNANNIIRLGEAKPLPEDMTPPQRSRLAAAAAAVVATYRRAGSPGLLKHIHSTQHFVHSCAVNAALEEAQPEGEGQ
ncbi:hypothetical protein [Brevundimonas naejangsanensis]|uniref:hypothetical protein n=1 Tax=Brevundimonas naejangsanensis TaxID=588932 RepID=UPI00106999DC|nr:hypothetical protein [Brevundimonas naejangsanensis]QBQ48272.1 hypothetical protein E3U41_05930 [Brevundimonas naejangsanensis]